MVKALELSETVERTLQAPDKREQAESEGMPVEMLTRRLDHSIPDPI